MLFSNKDIKNMIIPLFLEQLLLMLVGIVDTFVIAHCGEASVSGVSLVNQINTIFMMLFTALTSGGAIIISQYIGSKNQKEGINAASQLLMFSILFSLVISLLCLIYHKQILSFFFGKVEFDVMRAAITYFRISIFSYIFIAIYNVGAAALRSMALTKITMYISIFSNIINVVGNIVGVYFLKMDVAGVAWPSFIARGFSAIIVTIVCFDKDNIVFYQLKDILKYDKEVLSKILKVAIPNGLENGIFQFVKVALSSIVALFGTYQIAANGIAQSMWSLAAMLSISLGPVFITVIGQSYGSGDIDQTKYYFKKLIKLTLVLSILWNILIAGVAIVLVSFYNIEDITKELVIKLVIIHNIFNAISYPFAAPLGFGLRATGDVKFTMYVSIFTTIFIRLVFSYILALKMEMGVIGIALAMCMDWTFKGIVYYLRYRSNKWMNYKII